MNGLSKNGMKYHFFLLQLDSSYGVYTLASMYIHRILKIPFFYALSTSCSAAHETGKAFTIKSDTAPA
jgi:hypothetical protein